MSTIITGTCDLGRINLESSEIENNDETINDENIETTETKNEVR